MNNKKIKISTILLVLILIGTFTFSIIQSNKNNITIETSSNLIGNIDNKKREWGIKRNTNNEQPDLGKVNTSILDKLNGISMGNKETKKVYLTFDQGYEAGYTEKILETLKQNEVKATFFITAHYVNSAPELVQKMIDDGHIIGNHTVNHKSMPSLTTDQIKNEVMDLHTSIYQKFSYEMKYIRPPKGEYSERSIQYCNTLGYKTVMWSFAYDDWEEQKQGREEYAKKKILDNVHSGEVILLHGNSKDNANILDYCIKEIKKMGYQFESLDNFER